MNNPFEQLFEKLDRIEGMVRELSISREQVIQPEENDLLTITEASRLIRLAKPTIYYLSANSKIPVIKKGKRLYFSKIELLSWINSGRRATIEDISAEAGSYVKQRKAGRY